MVQNEYFERDLDLLIERIRDFVDPNTMDGLLRVRDKLVDMGRRLLVKINHSVMEVLVARHLLEKGFIVDVEHNLGNNIVCDVYGERGSVVHIVEVETGFVPPENALDPVTYWNIRVAAKIARYSIFSHKFSLAVPPYHILKIPEIFLEPPESRSDESLVMLKGLVDRYYRNPPITIDELKKAHLETIIIVNVDRLETSELTLNNYMKLHNVDYFYF
ncbi:MAG: hypothetical protein ACP5GU_09290 [Thermoprotei archaeon]|jgi:hypothetical protein